MDVRNAQPVELDPLARLWHDAWRDAHAEILPPALVKVRTLENFTERLARALPEIRVVGPLRRPLGLCWVKDDELYQLFVAAEARGTGVAAALVADAERTLAARGVRTAWLACAVGNARAARFYEKCGWHLARTTVSELEVPGGTFEIDVWRYEKSLPSKRGHST